MQQKVKGVCSNWTMESTIIGASFNPRSTKDEQKKNVPAMCGNVERKGLC